MDKIWYRNPSKSGVIGRCSQDEKTNDHAEPTKVEKRILFSILLELSIFILFS